MICVTLSRADISYVNRTISGLVAEWAAKGKSECFEIRNGLLAEYGVIKYFNEILGAVPRVAFRTEYVDGCDGGFDFSHHGVTYDVKESRVAEFEPGIFKSSKAQVFIGTTLEDTDKVHIHGFCPRSKLKSITMGPDDFASIDQLGRVPGWFDANNPARPRESEPESTKNLGPMMYLILAKAATKAGMTL